MDIQEAVTARLVHHQWKPRFLGYEEFSLSRDAIRNLQDRGWTVKEGFLLYDEIWGRTQALRVEYPSNRTQEEVFYGGADPRRGGAAVGF